MLDPITSSPLPKSIDPSSFTDVAVKDSSKSIDPSSFTSTSAERYVYDSPPTAADQETRAPSSESRRKTADKMNVNDVFFGNWKWNNILSAWRYHIQSFVLFCSRVNINQFC